MHSGNEYDFFSDTPVVTISHCLHLINSEAALGISRCKAR